MGKKKKKRKKEKTDLKIYLSVRCYPRHKIKSYLLTKLLLFSSCKSCSIMLIKSCDSLLLLVTFLFLLEDDKRSES